MNTSGRPPLSTTVPAPHTPAASPCCWPLCTPGAFVLGETSSTTGLLSGELLLNL